jgi:hypothetical protein
VIQINFAVHCSDEIDSSALLFVSTNTTNCRCRKKEID